MTLSEISIRHRVFAWMLMAALIIFGGISFVRMGVSQLPDVDFPVVTAQLTWLGAAPEIMETQIVDPVEDAVMSVEGVRKVTSMSYQGAATVTVEFELNRNIDAALQDVQTRVAQAQRLLPRDMDPPVITKTNPEDQPILWLALSSDQLPLRELMIYVRDQLKDRFTSIEGVGDIILGGYVEPNMRIWMSAEKLDRYYLSANDVIAAVRNEHSEPPSGYVSSGPRESNIRMFGEARTVRDFENMIINFRGATPNYIPIRIKQIARVEAGLADVRRISRTMQKPAVGIGIRKQRGANAVSVATAVIKRMEEVSKTLPKTFQLAVNFDSTRIIRETVHELNFTLLLSALLTAIVCWLFLGSWTSTLNVILAIPTSIVGSFIVLYFAGFTLNTFTLLGLSLAIGIVVDDAIMVLENIVRHMERGENRLEAALKGSRQITFAALAATVAIIAIFLPVAFMRGIIGRFFFQFGVTLTVAVSLSLLEALTLTPMRSATFLAVGERRTRIGRAVENTFVTARRGYTRLLALALQHRWKVVLGSLVFFALSFLSVRFLNKEFVPAQDQSVFLVRLETPVGSSIQFTDSKFREAEKFLLARPEVLRYYTSVGGFTGGQINTGIMFVTLTPPGERQLSQQEFMQLCRGELSKIPDVKPTIQDLSTRGFTASRGFPVEFSILGPDWEELGRHSEVIMSRLRETGLVTDINSDFQAGKPEIRVIPDRARAAAHATTISSVGEVISAMMGGQVVGQYSEGGRRYDVRVRLAPEELTRPGQVDRLLVRNNRGELVRLADLVRVETRPAFESISRQNRQRAITIYANVAPGKSQSDALNAAERISREVLPERYSAVMSGTAQTFTESFQSLLFVLVLGVVISYMVLGSQFDSFIDPVTVLMALPFSISGAFLALLAAGQSLNIYSLIGMVLLMGIVKKNSILLVDFTHQVRAGREIAVRDALLEACPIRLRPILMTSFATIAGAIPPALALGPGSETRIPMAVAVIGGIVFSTALTLFVVPCVYSLFARESRQKRVLRKAA